MYHGNTCRIWKFWAAEVALKEWKHFQALGFYESAFIIEMVCRENPAVTNRLHVLIQGLF